MRTTASTLGALVLALLVTVPAFAGVEQADTVTLTFELTLYGDVPTDTTFGVLYDFEDPKETDQAIPFCGQPKGYEPKEDCAGGDGTTYRESVKLPRGTRIFYLFAKFQPESGTDCEGQECPEGLQENFYATATELGQATGKEDYQTISADATKIAYYDANTGKGGGGKGPGPTGMPSTGAGGAAGSNPPLGGIAAAFAVVASLAGGSVARRRGGRLSR